MVGNETIYRGEQVPIENLRPLPRPGSNPTEAAAILREESERVRDAEAQPEDKRAEALKWALAENNVHRLIKLIQRIKKSVNVPVTTGEIWNIWRDHPQLANSVDFIAAHVLPYWENFTDKQAVDQAVAMLPAVARPVPRQAHHDRRIRLAERRL